MSLHPAEAPVIPEATARVARAAFPKGCLAMRVRDELDVLFRDAEFAAVFPVRGGPALSPGLAPAENVIRPDQRLLGLRQDDRLCCCASLTWRCPMLSPLCGFCR